MPIVIPARGSVPDPRASTQVLSRFSSDRPFVTMGISCYSRYRDPADRTMKSRLVRLTPLGRFTAFRQKYGVEP